MTDDGNTDNPYGDAAILAGMDNLTRDFRESEKASKQQIVQHMVKLRHNLQYNKHLMSVYMKAKAIFDEIVEERRSKIHHLDEIYRHLSKIIHEELMKSKKTKHTQLPEKKTSSLAMTELVKDKRKIGKLLSSMRKGLDKLMGIDTIIGTTIDKINEIEVSEEEEGGGGDDVETEGTDDEGDMEYVNEDDDEDDDETEHDDTETDVNDEDEGTEDDLEYVDAPDEDEDEDEDEGDEDEEDEDEDEGDEDEEDEGEEDEEDEDEEDEDEEDDDDDEEDEDEEEDEEDEGDDEDDDDDEEDDEDKEDEDEEEDDDDSEDEDNDNEPVVFY